MQPNKIVTGDKAIPVLLQARRGGGAKLSAPSGFIYGLEAGEDAGGHPFFQHQPATEVNAAQLQARVS